MENASNFKKRYTFSDIELLYSNCNQVLGMGGPFVANMSLNGKKIPGKFSGPPCLSDDMQYLLVPKVIDVVTRFIFIKIKNIRFVVYVIDLTSYESYLSNKEFELLFIEKMTQKNIICCEANHGASFVDREVIRFDTANFKKVEVTVV